MLLQHDDNNAPSSEEAGRSPATSRPCLRVEPWLDPVIDNLGHDPRSAYVETFWLPVLGPSTTWLLRHLTTRLEESPDGVELTWTRQRVRSGSGSVSARTPPSPAPSSAAWTSAWPNGEVPFTSPSGDGSPRSLAGTCDDSPSRSRPDTTPPRTGSGRWRTGPGRWRTGIRPVADGDPAGGGRDAASAG